MNRIEAHRLLAAAGLIANSGHTFDASSSYVAHGNAYAFSVESADGTSASGPAAWATVYADGAAFLNNRHA